MNPLELKRKKLSKFNNFLLRIVNIFKISLHNEYMISIVYKHK